MLVPNGCHSGNPKFFREWEIRCKLQGFADNNIYINDLVSKKI